jgi:ATP-dependent Lon protease
MRHESVQLSPGYRSLRTGQHSAALLIPQSLYTILEQQKQREADADEAYRRRLAEQSVNLPPRIVEAPPADPTPAILPPTGICVHVFESAALNKLIEERRNENGERSQRQLPGLEIAAKQSGTRGLITERLSVILSGLRALQEEMPNFEGVIGLLAGELALALAGAPEKFRVTAICMNGAPGIGKTRFAKKVAHVLDVGFDAISMGSTAGFELCGTSSGYGNSKAGRIFQLLADGDSACPIVLLDELDKMAGDERYPVLPVLLELLEAESAHRFRDEALELRLDASKIIFLATSNEAEHIPGPLRSRLRVVEIQPPTPAQRREIARRIALEFEAMGLVFQPRVLDILAGVDMDLRAMHRFLRDQAGRALAEGKKEVRSDDIEWPVRVEKRIGFPD